MPPTLRRFLGAAPTEPTPEPPTPEPTASAPEPDDTVSAMGAAAEVLKLRDLWDEQPPEVQEAWTAYGAATSDAERHHHAATVIHRAAAACKRHEPWAETPAVREAFARAGRSWDIAEARRRQGAGQ